jgi:hypothetical protein
MALANTPSPPPVSNPSLKHIFQMDLTTIFGRLYSLSLIFFFASFPEDRSFTMEFSGSGDRPLELHSHQENLC